LACCWRPVAGNGITKRLRLLADDAATLASGALHHRSGVDGRDEVGVLGQALNRMAEALEERTRELTRSTEDLSLITANVPVLIAYIDATQRFRFANEYHRDVFRIPPEKLIGRSLRELFTPGTYARLLPRINEVLGGLPASFETTFDARSAAPYFLVSCFPDYGDDNTVRGFYAVCQDITRRREAEATLAARERFIQLITDTLPARITYLDTDGCVQFGNRVFRNTWGVSEEDCIGQPLEAVVPPEVYAQIGPRLARGLAGERLRYELLSAGPTGEQQLDVVHYVPDLDAEGRVQGLFTISQDVTQLKRLEAARAESEKRIRTIADNVPAAIAYLNRHERYLFANAAFLTSFGTLSEDLVGQRVADVLPPDVYALTRPHIEAVLRGERQRFQRVVTRHGAGAPRARRLPAGARSRGRGDRVLRAHPRHHRPARRAGAGGAERAAPAQDHGERPALICYIDRERRYRFNSRFYEEWLDRPLAEITGRTVLEVLGVRTHAVDSPYIERAFAGEHVDFELEHTDARGTRCVRGSYVPDLDADGEVIGIYGVTTDITPLKRVERELARLAQFDSLTGLVNRSRFDTCITEALARARRVGTGVGLLFLDIDGFKRINDTPRARGGRRRAARVRAPRGGARARDRHRRAPRRRRVHRAARERGAPRGVPGRRAQDSRGDAHAVRDRRGRHRRHHEHRHRHEHRRVASGRSAAASRRHRAVQRQGAGPRPLRGGDLGRAHVATPAASGSSTVTTTPRPSGRSSAYARPPWNSAISRTM
jgi:PAS domain S-box-containing protein